MNNINISCILNDIQKNHDPSLFDFADNKIAKTVFKFHKSLPGYEPTPLVNLSSLAKKLAIAHLFIKDESKRFDLNAFKVLGASYAIARVLANKLNLDKDEMIFNKILSRQPEFQNTTFVTATDGNHGRAVAWVSEKLCCKAVVYLPKNSSRARLKAIKQFGAKAFITDYNYDDTVIYANNMAEQNNWILLQDTSWEGYEDVPTHIMQGYFTLVTEFLFQKPKIWPTHIFLQAGVGSLAAGVLAGFQNISQKNKPKFIVVEPSGAPCLYESMKLRHGKPYRVRGDLPTIMAGLACGEPSILGLKILKSGARAFIKCSDHVARRGMKILGNALPGDESIISGESGAVTLGLVYELLSNKRFRLIKNELDITKDAKILLFSTEGDTDPDSYNKIIRS
ncbi:MAG: diaminopropionate ammonia-lyase [Desulfobacula sp.]|jgi:diaminopropionate ammonia-lyase|uniref:diaminopropionate ammonia-lyase n=1 Tax=Desulfobacula sp. TaxID=2593537 RepID=UPI001DD71A44|nr:diaminopropionate ammonia-lyase [Desulfobacula sp.]MBT3485365.1 diaminopropionate ammonia-lyase [Desulfobacula sp.]MBT3803783.1 diaminopropionate ammonia-lyase [Desulfobacula sp.]MBT4026617.1 diaminopropionate ammonia-lyase [Desulfobacula sp.]MBT4200528.1 diaminopropionate ammonia-lyase [Desulfobacula sp.]